MIRNFFNLKLWVLGLLAATTVGHASPDTVVLKSSEYRFPETHPGKVFSINHLLINDVQGLKKEGPTILSSPSSPVSSKLVTARVNRDALGRVLKSSEYASRMARILKSHSLPTSARAGLGATVKVTPDKTPVKYLKSPSAKFVMASNSPLIRSRSDLTKMELLERQAKLQKYGALSRDLAFKLQTAKASDSIEVVIELAKEHPGFLGPSASLEERKENASQWAKIKSLIAPKDFARREGIAPLDEANHDLIKVRTDVRKIHKLAFLGDVVSIFEPPKVLMASVPGSGSLDYQALLNSAYNPASSMMFRGSRNIAHIDGGPIRQAYFNCINPSLRPVSGDISNVSPTNFTKHAESTYHLLALGTPDSDRRLWHYPGFGVAGNRYPFNYHRQRIIDEGIAVASASLVGPWMQEVFPDSRVVDAFSYIGPYPLIVLPAGNDGHQSVSASVPFNSLVVGNVQHYDKSTYTLDLQLVPFTGSPPITYERSQSTNPLAKYYYANDRELPSLVSPGTTPDPWWELKQVGGCILNENGQVESISAATSFSTPVLAAVATNVHSALGLTWHPSAPIKTRAALLVTAENVDGYVSSPYYDERDGMGTVSGSNAVSFAENASSVEPGDPAVIDGIAYGTLDGSDFSNWSPRVYNYKVPSSFPTGKHLRVVLTWTGSPGVSADFNELSQLGLEATTDNWTWFTMRDNGNVLSMDFEQPQNAFISNGEYQFTIYPWQFRTAPDGPTHLHYSIAWTWVKSHAD